MIEVVQLGTIAMIDSCTDFLGWVENKAVLILAALWCMNSESDLSMMWLVVAANR